MSSVRDYSETYVKRATEKANAVLLCRILFFGCFFVAIFIANTLWKNEAAWIGYLHETMVMNLPNQVDNGLNNLGIVLKQRLPMWIFLVFLGRNIWGIVVAQVHGAWQGFILGFLMSSLIIRYGLYGSLFFVLLGCPQFLVYVFAYVFLYKMNFACWNRKRRARIYGETLPENGGSGVKQILIYIMLTLLFLAGIVLESYVNVIFLSKMVGLMKIF